MDTNWQREFRHRMKLFSQDSEDGDSVSIKVRVQGGCFHRDHSPEAYKLIDEYIASSEVGDGVSIQEHESGPELLVWLALGAAGMGLAKSIIDLITVIIKARSEGIKNGDSPDAPLELIVRGYYKDGEYHEETVLRIGHKEQITNEQVKSALEKPINNIQRKSDKGKKRK